MELTILEFSTLTKGMNYGHSVGEIFLWIRFSSLTLITDKRKQFDVLFQAARLIKMINEFVARQCFFSKVSLQFVSARLLQLLLIIYLMMG